MARLLVSVFFLTISTWCGAQEWTRFRGPNGTGISEARTIPTQWTTDDFNWKTPLPGIGHSSPVLWGEKLFVTSCDETSGRFFVICLSATDGSSLWQRDYSITLHHKHDFNSFASATPAVDAERVYVCHTDPEHVTLLALDHQGQQLWERDLGPLNAQHGGGTSPIVHNGMVIFANEQNAESFLIALDARTGEIRWKTPRKSGSSDYSTPCMYTPEGSDPQLIFNSQPHGISALDPATGKILWSYAEAFDKRSVSSPIVAGGLIIGSCGSGGGGNYVVAVKPGLPRGSKAELAYQIRRSAPYVPTSICVGEWLYLWSDGGIVSRVHAATGEVKWQERVGGNFFSSPVSVDGRLFCVSASGEVVVLATGEQFEVLARNSLDETTRSTPAIANGRMFIHTSGHVISIGGAMPGDS